MFLPKIGAENITEVNWNFGKVGVGLNLSESDFAGEFTVSAINIAFEQKELNIGFEFNPVKYWILFNYQNNTDEFIEDSKISFINAALYWDLIEKKSIFFGPVMSAHYMFVNSVTGISMNDYIFSGGLRFSYQINKHFKYYNSQIISSEIGYRNITGKNKLYFSVYADVILVLISIGSVKQYSYENNAQ